MAKNIPEPIALSTASVTLGPVVFPEVTLTLSPTHLLFRRVTFFLTQRWSLIPHSWIDLRGLRDLVIKTECDAARLGRQGQKKPCHYILCSRDVCSLDSRLPNPAAMLLGAQAIWRVCMWVLGPLAQLSPDFKSSSPQAFSLAIWGPGKEQECAILLLLS